MDNEKLILQKIDELSQDMKDFLKDFNEHKERVSSSNEKMVELNTRFNYLYKEFNEHKVENKDQVDNIWQSIRKNNNFLENEYKEKILKDAQKNAKIMALTAIVLAVVIPAIQHLIQVAFN